MNNKIPYTKGVMDRQKTAACFHTWLGWKGTCAFSEQWFGLSLYENWLVFFFFFASFFNLESKKCDLLSLGQYN